MTTNRVTLAELANQEQRDRRTREAIQVQGELVKQVLKEFNIRCVGDQTPIADAMWDANYCVESEGVQPRLFAITARGHLKGETLEKDIRSQIKAALSLSPEAC
jgi:hypothetical protein